MTSKIKHNYSAYAWNQVRCESFSKYFINAVQKDATKGWFVCSHSTLGPSMCPTHTDPLTGGENGGHKEKNLSPDCQNKSQMMDLLQ